MATASPDDNSMEVDEPQVRLKTGDGKRFTLSKSEASCSNALKSMMEGSSHPNNSNQNDYITLHSVNSQWLAPIVVWCREHCGENAADEDSRRRPCGASDDHDRNAACPLQSEPELSEWDKQFLASFAEEDLLRLMHVANYLDVRSLFSACCRTMARKWEGKSVAEIRRMYRIEGDFAPEEEHQMLQENKRLGMSD